MGSMVHKSALHEVKESNRKLRERITALEQEVETHKARATAREQERDAANERAAIADKARDDAWKDRDAQQARATAVEQRAEEAEVRLRDEITARGEEYRIAVHRGDIERARADRLAGVLDRMRQILAEGLASNDPDWIDVHNAAYDAHALAVDVLRDIPANATTASEPGTVAFPALPTSAADEAVVDGLVSRRTKREREKT